VRGDIARCCCLLFKGPAGKRAAAFNMSAQSTAGAGGNKPDVIDAAVGGSSDALAKDHAGHASGAAQKAAAEQKKCRFCGGTGSDVYHDHSDGSSHDIQCSSCKGTGLSAA
jgi:NADH pyrophosphatase NudC (nudix superfamily)